MSMMKEIRDILQAIDEGLARGERLALATIVGVQGSTYRREGARLLVTAGGQMTGNISGGCLEGDVAVVADQVMGDGTPRLATYDLTADDDLVWGLGLGCNGAVDVLVEPVKAQSTFLQTMRRALDEEASVALAVVVSGHGTVPTGTRLTLQRDGQMDGGLPDAAAQDRFRRAMDAALREGRSRRRTISSDAGDLDIFIEVLRPPIRLAVVGAGHDAISVVSQSVALGWRVIVADNREVYLKPDRFPGAAFLRASFAEAAAQLPLDDRTAVVVMTHNYVHDKDVLRGLLTRPGDLPFYVGMLGPRARTEKITAELAAEGVVPSPQARVRLHGPVGLDVGSEGPEEIALAIVAEILAVERARRAGFLRDRAGSIHAPAPR